MEIEYVQAKTLKENPLGIKTLALVNTLRIICSQWIGQ